MTSNHQKVVIILGAGATLAYLPKLSTEALCGQLFDADAWHRLLDEFDDIRNSRVIAWPNQEPRRDARADHIEHADVMQVLGYIKRRLEPPSAFSTADFDTVIHLCDKLSAKLSADEAGAQNIDAVLLDQTPKSLKLTGKSDRQGWQYFPYLCREIIAGAILQSWNCEQELRAKALEDYRVFMTAIQHLFESVSIYSFNYDPLLYEALKTEQFIESGFGDNQLFSAQDFLGARNVMAHMHGHLGFIPVGTNVMKFIGDYDAARRKRLAGLAGLEFARIAPVGIGSKGNHYDTYLVTGLDKIGAFTVNPFAAYLTRAVQDIKACSHVLLIGASLSDYYFGALLRNIFIGGKRRIIAVNKDDIDIKLKLLTYFDNNPVAEDVHADRADMPEPDSKSGAIQLSEYIRLYQAGAKEFFSQASNVTLTDLLQFDDTHD